MSRHEPRLTYEQAQEIRNKYVRNPYTGRSNAKDLSQEYKVSYNIIMQIMCGRAYTKPPKIKPDYTGTPRECRMINCPDKLKADNICNRHLLMRSNVYGGDFETMIVCEGGLKSGYTYSRARNKILP